MDCTESAAEDCPSQGLVHDNNNCRYYVVYTYLVGMHANIAMSKHFGICMRQ